MLIIDDNMYKLAKMQESLLNVTNKDKNYHLEKYINIVKEIDSKAFDDLINIMKDVIKYNQTLEIELSYLETVKKAYEQLLELQMKFISVCEKHGNNNLELSDLSILNIDYVEGRISAINGYLLNGQNIEKNKQKLEKLNEQLADEEKKRDFLNKKLLILERKLKDDFIQANAKQIVFGKLEKFDIVSEYERFGYDVISLIQDESLINNKFRNINIQLNEITEKYETAKVCYQNLHSSDSKHVMEEIEKEFYTTKYKYVMLKILKLLNQEVLDHDLAKVKRYDFIDLIKVRDVCLEKIGINNPINILSVVNIDSQLDEIQTLIDSVKNIHNIRKEISELSLRTEEMINQNNDYLLSLSDTKELIQSKVSLNDIDITTFEDIIADEVKGEPLSNQVVKVKNVTDSFKLNIARQKAAGVIERICKINFKEKDIETKVKEEYVPELLIGPKEQINKKIQEEILEEPTIEIPTLSLELSDDISNNLIINDNENEEKNVLDVKQETFESVDVIKPVEVPLMTNDDFKEEVVDEIQEVMVPEVINVDIFETTTPFDAPVLFADRTDNESLMPKSMNIISEPENVIVEQVMVPDVSDEIQTNEEVPLMPELTSLPQITDEGASTNVVAEAVMPDAFWITDEVQEKVESDEESRELSFEEQINALLAENNNETVIKRR